MNEVSIDNMSITDLVTIKDILTKKLDEEYKWMNKERGKNYGEYSKRELEYYNNENHKKLEKVKARIEIIIEGI